MIDKPIISYLAKTGNANKKFKTYYESIRNQDVLKVPLKRLLQIDIRYSYGIFLDFFHWHNIILDVNTKGFSAYLIKYSEDIPKFVFEEYEGDFYIARRYITLNNYKIPTEIQNNYLSLQYNMYQGIIAVMQYINIELQNEKEIIY